MGSSQVLSRLLVPLCALLMVAATTAALVAPESGDSARLDQAAGLAPDRSWLTVPDMPDLGRLTELSGPAAPVASGELAAGPLAGTGAPLPTRVFGSDAADRPTQVVDRRTQGTERPAPAMPERPAPAMPEEPAPAIRGPVRGATEASAPGSARERGLAALRSLPYPWQELGVSLDFRPYNGGLLGLYDPQRNRVTVYVSDRHSAQGLRVTIAHELGHALDAAVGTTASRRAYLVARGLSASTPWLPCRGCSDFASGAGDFAEVFALQVAGRGDFRSQLAGEPTPAELQRLAPFFRPPSERTPPPPPPPPPVKRPAPTPSPAPASKNLLDILLGG